MRTRPLLPHRLPRATACLLSLLIVTGCAGRVARSAPAAASASREPTTLGGPPRPAPAIRRRSLARPVRGADTIAGTWRERGSSNQAGRTQVTVLGLDGQTLVIGTGGGGLFAGSPQTGWQPRGDNLGFDPLGFGVRQLHLSPSPETWLAASYFSDVAVSLDRGATWMRPSGLPGFILQIFRLVADGGDPRTVYLLVQTQKEQTQLFRSTDGGLHFTGLATFATNAAYGLGVGDDLWTSRTASGPLYVLLGKGLLLRSTDRGATFSQVAQVGPGSTNTAVFAGSEAGAPTLYAFLGTDFGGWQLFASDDGGTTWEGRFSPGTIFFSGNSGIGTSTEDPNLVLFGGVLAYRSTDGGRTFAQLSSVADYYPDPVHKLHGDIDGFETFRWQGRESIFIDTDGGTFVTQDKGLTVLNVTAQGFPDSQYYSTASSSKNPDLIAAGAQDQGLQLSHPASGLESFDQPYAGDAGNLVAGSPDLHNLYDVFPGGGLLYWADPTSGNNAVGLQVPLQKASFFPALVVDPADPTSCYVGGDHIWHVQHADRGRQATLTQLPQDFSAGGTDYITAFTISPADPQAWLAVTFGGKLSSSHDGGATWGTPVSVASTFSGTALLASTRDPRTAYAGGAGNDATGVYRTTDGGATWTPMSTGLPTTYVSQLAFDGPTTENLYAATWSGPFRFDAGTGKWESLLGTQAPLLIYYGVEGVPAANVVRFATFGRGVWDYVLGPAPTPPPPSHCDADAQTLCLGAGRFLVRASWENQFDGTSGYAGALARSDAAGFFTFGDPANVELLVKILPFDTTVKVFYGELTNLHFTLTVTDIRTGTVKTYGNTAGDCGGIDQAAFPKSTAGPKRAGGVGGSSGACRPGPTTLCLQSDRFALSVAWANPGNGTHGQAGAVRLASDVTGAFFFTDPSNLELLAKVIDLGDRVAVFYGALSDLDYTLTVTDTRSGQARTYHNQAGNFCGGLDNAGFPP